MERYSISSISFVFIYAAMRDVDLGTRPVGWILISALGFISAGAIVELLIFQWDQRRNPDDLAVTDQRILMGGGAIAWILGIGPKGISTDPSGIDVITAEKSDKYSTINIALHDGRRFDFWVARHNHRFRNRLADILGRPLQLVNYD